MKGDSLQQFYLQRNEDLTGTSGTGVVARGCVLPSGKVILEWTSFHTSIGIYNNINDVELIHGHEGRTQVVMGSPTDKPKRKKING